MDFNRPIIEEEGIKIMFHVKIGLQIKQTKPNKDFLLFMHL